MQEHCGVNGACTRQSYDQFGRRRYRWDAVGKNTGWGSEEAAQVKWTYTAFGNGQKATTIEEAHNPRSEGNFVRRLYNGLGELIQEQRPYPNWSANDGKEIIVDYLYDPLGNQTRVSVPWLTPKYGTGDYLRSAGWSNGYTETTYDPLGRPKQITAPNGEKQQYNYVDRQMSIVGVGRNGDANRVLKWQETDGLGNLKYVRTYDKPGGTKEDEVALQYNLLGNLTKAIHAESLGTTTIEYDLGGRKTKLIDPDLGTWHYAYDRQGNLLRQTDARKQTTCLYYDAFGRLRDQYFRNDSNATILLDCPTNLTTYDLSA